MEELIYYSTLTVALVTVAMLIGIVLRVEQILDISYKFLLLAGILFALMVIVDLMIVNQMIETWLWRPILQLTYALLVALGVWEMRYLVRRLDGEVQKGKNNKK